MRLNELGHCTVSVLCYLGFLLTYAVSQVRSFPVHTGGKGSHGKALARDTQRVQFH
jgi:hypothetical protein